MTSWSDNNIFRVFYKDKTGTIEGSRFNVHLGHLFTQVCERPETRFAACSCTKFNSNSARDGYELLIYLVADHAATLLPGQPLGGLGTTGVRNGGAVSEIYVNEFQGVPDFCMAKLAFHELMHNKLRMSDDLHWNGGQGLADDVMNINLCAAPFSSFQLTEENKRLMAEKLDDVVPQNFRL